jgi:DNA (cytosine-5)-methyltransferase 1
MSNFQDMPPTATSVIIRGEKLVFSSLRKLFERHPATEQAAITHFLQTKKPGQRNFFVKQTKDALPVDVFSLINENGILWDVPFPPVQTPDFTFIDLFAGIGGMRLALQKLNGKCVFSSEWDLQAQITYSTNFGEVPFGDITKINAEDVPKHNILVAGFPCQAFSIAGFKGGFDDTRGTLFFDVARIIKAQRPDAFLLENVKGLVGHDKGKTLSVILRTLREDLGYYVPDPRVINARDFGVPQNRERIFIVGFKSKAAANRFSYPEALKTKKVIADIKEKGEVPVKYYLSKQYLSTLKAHRQRHSDKGNGFGYEVISDDAIANAIVVGGMGRERNLLIDYRLTDFTPTTNIKGPVNREGIRKMTPREWARLQGFPDKYQIPVSDAQAYKQFGNSVAVPAVHATAKSLLKALRG